MKCVNCSSIALFKSLKPIFHILKVLKSLQGLKIQDFQQCMHLYTSACYTRDKLVAFYLIII